jgi:hypothetical protein
MGEAQREDAGDLSSPRQHQQRISLRASTRLSAGYGVARSAQPPLPNLTGEICSTRYL